MNDFSPFGTSEAFYAAFSEYYPKLVSYARRFGAIYPEDITQESFVILMQREDKIEHPVAFLYGTVRTLALTERRPLKNQNISLEFIVDHGKEGDAYDALLSHEIRKEIQKLPVTFREAIWLFVVDGLSVREISHVLEIPEATVKTRIHRAKAQLRDQLNPGGHHVMV